ncbi:MAG TPA: hypothetical protein VJH92_02605 [Candidatus Nanoarchaeia archaeon]|nr:hypothetical protein [Candidatus Nanoarchaeia archaeon]
MTLTDELKSGEVELHGIKPDEFDFYSEMYTPLLRKNSNYDLANIVMNYEQKEHDEDSFNEVSHTEEFARYSVAVDILEERVKYAGQGDKKPDYIPQGSEISSKPSPQSIQTIKSRTRSKPASMRQPEFAFAHWKGS